MWNSSSGSLRFRLLPALLLLIACRGARAQDASSLPDARVGQDYEYHLAAEGGVPPLAWRVVRGELPPGIVLDSAAGLLRGKPETPRTDACLFIIEVTDSSAPPQAYSQAFSLAVQAAPLRIVLGAKSLRIKPPKPTAFAPSDSNSRSVAPSGAVLPQQPPAPSQTRESPAQAQPAVASANTVRSEAKPILIVYRLSDAIRALPSAEIRGQAAPGVTTPTPSSSHPSPTSFSPATFVCLYEDTAAGDRYWMYRPDSSAECDSATSSKFKKDFVSEGATRLLSADENSTIVINLDRLRMGQDLPFNKVFISAQIGLGDQQKNLEVEGYSMVGVAKENTAAQRGVAFQSVRDVQAQVARMAEIAEDILRFVLGNSAGTQLNLNDTAGQPRDSALRSTLAGTATAPGPEMVARLEEILRLYRKEISDASDFLNAPQNLSIVQFIATNVLPIGSRSLISAAGQVKEDLTTALDGQSKDLARNQALLALWDRNVRLYQNFAPLRAEVARFEDMDSNQLAALPFPPYPKSRIQQLSDAKEALGTITVSQCRQGSLVVEQIERCAGLKVAAINLVAAHLGIIANEAQKKLFAQGSFSLRANGAKAGNVVTLTVQAMGADGATVGIPSVWEIEVKQFGLKHAITDSFLFLYRLGLSSKDTMVPAGTPGMPLPVGTIPPVKAINFAPSPGVTLGLTYYKRGTSAWDKFWRGLAPGLGVNVSFMNFDDPGFDLSTGTFTNTAGTNIQVGTGVIYSLFGNSIQFTNGWNLNVDRKRAYFGVGFSFVDFTKKVAAVIKKSS